MSGRFSYTTEDYQQIREDLEKLKQPYIFATDDGGGMHVTENLDDYSASVEHWMEMLGGLWMIGIDYIARKRGAAEAKAFLARSLNILNAIADESPNGGG